MVIWFDDLSLKDIDLVGGKNASLGELMRHLVPLGLGIQVPPGFAIPTTFYRSFLQQDSLQDRIYQALHSLVIDDTNQLAKIGKTIRKWIIDTPFNHEFKNTISAAYAKLNNAAVAVRSSATAEDLVTASFAGQQDTILNVQGINDLLIAIKKVFASLFTDRAIAYRTHNNFQHQQVLLSVGIQQMIRSDLAASGVMFTLDTESGFDGVVFITSSYGLGELIVQGAVNPDEFYVDKRTNAIVSKVLGSKQQKMVYANINTSDSNFVTTEEVSLLERQKFSLTNDEIIKLAQAAILIEQHYQKPMDIEWAKDGINGQLYILQARPETVNSQNKNLINKQYFLQNDLINNDQTKILTTGRSIGKKIGHGTARIILNTNDMSSFQTGEVLVADMTEPDWEPIMKKAAAIVTNRGGRTCHAAIIARELGIPAVVGCNNATEVIKSFEQITVSCADGEIGKVYQGLIPYSCRSIELDNLYNKDNKLDKKSNSNSNLNIKSLNIKLMMNIGNPNQAFFSRQIPNDGVGLARLEFIINHMIGIHPKACLNFAKLPNEIKQIITHKTAGYNSPLDYYVDKLAEGIAILGVAFWPKPVIVRFSDFKSNEYASLIGGNLFEPNEENPMLGFRGAARYLSDEFKSCFELECRAFRKVRELNGLTNIQIMIPFVRTLQEAKQVINLLAENGLKSGVASLKIIMMCEIPANVLLAEEFLQYFDGFSIGSNDLTQLTLGIDRDSSLVAHLFNEQDAAVKKLLQQVIQICKKHNKYVGICGQAPSDYPEFARWLMQSGIDSISLTPDAILETWQYLK